MKKFSKKKNLVFTPDISVSHEQPHKAFRIGSACALILAPVLLVSLGACGKTIDYFDYVSELRSNILLAEQEDFSLRVYATEKESPYTADGVKRAVSPRAEIYLTGPVVTESCDISFIYDGKEYGGDMSFDNVKLEYFYSCTLDISAASSISFKITIEETSLEMTATTVCTDNMLSPKEVVEKIQAAESEKFKSLTDSKGFAGEIYLRLNYEDAPYYYIGIIDREGTIFALLVDSESGKILAKREM